MSVNQKVSVFEISIKEDIWSIIDLDNKSIGKEITSGPAIDLPPSIIINNTPANMCNVYIQLI